MIKHNTIRQNTIQYDSLPYDIIQYDTIRYDMMQYNVIWCITLYGTAPPDESEVPLKSTSQIFLILKITALDPTATE